MNDRLYEVISLAARYWFALLGVLIVWRTFSWLRRDRRRKHKRLRQLPDAGIIGEWVVVRGNVQLPVDDTLPIPWEGVIGAGRGCDVNVPAAGVRKYHADCSFEEGKGLLVLPRFGRAVVIDGETVHARRAEAAEHRMRHGSFIEVGDAVFRLRVLMGLGMEHSAPRVQDDVPRRAVLPDPEPIAAQEAEPMIPQPDSRAYRPAFRAVQPQRRMPKPRQSADAISINTGAETSPAPSAPMFPRQPAAQPSPLDGLRPVRRYRSAGRRTSDEP